MIEKHFNLSCFAIEHPYKVQYSNQGQELVDLIDNNNDVYEFKLPDHEHYEKIAGDFKIKQLRRIGKIWIMLNEKGELIVRRNMEELYRFDNIQSIEQYQNNEYFIFLLKDTNYLPEKELSLVIGFVAKEKNAKKDNPIYFRSYGLMEEIPEHQNYYFQKYVNHGDSSYYKIDKLFGRCCLITDKYGQRIVLKLELDQLMLGGELTVLKYCRLNFELNEKMKTIANCGDKLLLKDEKDIYLLDGESETVVAIKSMQPDGNTEFIAYRNYIISLEQLDVCIYECFRGNLMAKFNIVKMLEESQEGSSIVVAQNQQKQGRYSMLYDQFNRQLTHFYLIDKEKTSLFYVNLQKLIQKELTKPISTVVEEIEQDKDSIHENVMKTVNFRLKKIQSLQNYIEQDYKINSFANSVRFLLNQPNIFVFNDGITLLFNFTHKNIEKISQNKFWLADVEKDFVKMCHKLVTESKYEGHIENGLKILNSIYASFRKFDFNEGLQANKPAYSKILETNRVIKLLKQDKKKKLFQLSYELAIKIRGFKYVQELQKKK